MEFNYNVLFSADTRAAADEMFIPVEEAAENGSGEATGQFENFFQKNISVQ